MSSAYALLHADLIAARAQGRRLPELFAAIAPDNQAAAADLIAAWPRVIHRLARDGALNFAPPRVDREAE
jgi:hypothetical protein